MITEEEKGRQRAARKARSEAILDAAGIRHYGALPAIETADEIEVRAPEEIARRAICLMLVAAKGSGIDADVLQDLIGEYRVAGSFTPDEQAFLDDAQPSDHAEVQFSWRSEASWVLLWALGFVPTLGLPTEQVAPDDAIEILEEHHLEGLVAKAKVRSYDEILDEADLIYRIHWVTRQVRQNGMEPPPSLDPGITMERHHALNWLIGYEGQDWDEVTTDT